jgi:transcriptional regulator with XRE-family HTH domain
MRVLYTKPVLKDLSQGSRIAFARQFRRVSQDYVSDNLGLTGECKRRTMTRYEKGERNPKDDRTLEISKILNVNFNSIKKYDFNNPIDLIYIFLWLEELIPNYQIDLSIIQNVKNKDVLTYKNFIDEWNVMRKKRKHREISYEEYLEWKLNFELEVDGNE